MKKVTDEMISAADTFIQEQFGFNLQPVSPKKRYHRRSNGEGSIRLRPNGLWEGRYTAGYDRNTGKPIRKSIYAKTKSAVIDELSKQRAIPGIVQTNATLEELISVWLSEFKKENNNYRTQQSYSYVARNYIVPNYGRLKVNKLTPAQLREIYSYFATNCSPALFHHIVVVLKSALRKAVVDGIIIKSPADNVPLPRMEKTNNSRRSLTRDEQRRFVDSLSGDDKYLYMTYLLTGMRRGEALALTWEDIDFDGNRISVKGSVKNSFSGSEEVGTTKTKRSRRIPLFPQLAKLLLELKANRNPLPTDSVFIDRYGKRITLDNASKRFAVIRDKLEMSTDLTLHCLRHTFATRAEEAHISPTVIAAWLGHATVSMTKNTYTDVQDEYSQEEAAKLADKF